MKRIKRTLRLLAFICLLFLAVIGVGLSGGVPIPNIKNRKDSETDNIELIEDQDKKSSSKELLE